MAPGMTIREFKSPAQLFGILHGILDMFIGMPWSGHPAKRSSLLTTVNSDSARAVPRLLGSLKKRTSYYLS
jgi:hypothetical protein